MISIGMPPTISPSTPTRRVKDQDNARVADTKQSSDANKRATGDRRKIKDRRRQQRKGKFLDLRSGEDRRKSSKPGKRTYIDTTA